MELGDAELVAKIGGLVGQGAAQLGLSGRNRMGNPVLLSCQVSTNKRNGGVRDQVQFRPWPLRVDQFSVRFARSASGRSHQPRPCTRAES